MPQPTLVGPEHLCACDKCHRPTSEWPMGLCCVDREQGTFTGDFITCPDCLPETLRSGDGGEGLVGFLRQGVVFSYIDYYWFDPTYVEAESSHAAPQP